MTKFFNSDEQYDIVYQFLMENISSASIGRQYDVSIHTIIKFLKKTFDVESIKQLPREKNDPIAAKKLLDQFTARLKEKNKKPDPKVPKQDLIKKYQQEKRKPTTKLEQKKKAILEEERLRRVKQAKKVDHYGSLNGQIFDKLVVVDDNYDRDKEDNRLCLCKCECGRHMLVQPHWLIRGLAVCCNHCRNK